MTGPMSSQTALLADVIVPLEEAEQRQAVEAALAHTGLRRPLVYAVELRIDKRRRTVPVRRIAVLLADLDRYSVYEVVLDDDWNVVEDAERPELVPPFSAEEIEEAMVLARNHMELADIARRWGVRTAVFYPADNHDHGTASAGRGRRVGVHFLDFSDPASVTPVASAIVDLTGREVENVQHHQAGR